MQNEIETAFQQATKVLFGKALSGIGGYAKWLNHNTREHFAQKSAVSDYIIYAPPFELYRVPRNRSVSYGEALKIGEKALSNEDAGKVSLANATKMLKDISYYAPEAHFGEIVNVERCGVCYNSSFCSDGENYSMSKYCAYAHWPRESEYIFGSDIAFSCKFCIKCYNCIFLTRCFEASNSAASSDCYFCHNVENCHDSMFCFNVKNKKYAIGNVEYPRDDYLKFKQKILTQIADELEKTHSLKYDIYNIGCIGKK